MTADVDVLLGKAYEGEALGEAFFGRLSELTDEADEPPPFHEKVVFVTHSIGLPVTRRTSSSTVNLRPC